MDKYRFLLCVLFQSINFSTTVVNEALGKEKQFKNFFANVESYLRQPVRTLSGFYASSLTLISCSCRICNNLPIIRFAWFVSVISLSDRPSSLRSKWKMMTCTDDCHDIGVLINKNQITALKLYVKCWTLFSVRACNGVLTASNFYGSPWKVYKGQKTTRSNCSAELTKPKTRLSFYFGPL